MAVELRPRRRLRAHRLKPVGALLEDERHALERLDVVDDGRLGERARDRRERRRVARPPPPALERFEQAGLLAADVRARAAVDVALDLVLTAEDPTLPKDAVRVG